MQHQRLEAERASAGGTPLHVRSAPRLPAYGRYVPPNHRTAPIARPRPHVHAPTRRMHATPASLYLGHRQHSAQRPPPWHLDGIAAHSASFSTGAVYTPPQPGPQVHAWMHECMHVRMHACAARPHKSPAGLFSHHRQATATPTHSTRRSARNVKCRRRLALKTPGIILVQGNVLVPGNVLVQGIVLVPGIV